MKDIKIKCKCGYEDYVQSQFCSCCKREFNDEQKSEAFKKTPFGKYQEFQKKKSSFNKIVNIINDPIDQMIKELTNKRPIKIAIIVLLIVLGTYMYVANRPLWNHLMILPGDNYSVSKVNKTYGLSTDTNEIDLKIACVKEVDKATVSLKDEDAEVVNKDSRIKVIKYSTYVLHVDYTDGTFEELEFSFN